MTKQEILERLEELENMDFSLKMIDHWYDSDYKKSWEIHNEQFKLKGLLDKGEYENE